MRVFTTCVNYADYLAVTLPAWQKIADVHVITRENDRDTWELCRAHNVPCSCTPAWYSNESPGINKGAAMNAVILPLARPGELMAVFDADSYPVGDISQVDPAALEVVGCRRFLAKTQDELDGYMLGASLPEIKSRGMRLDLVRGYFQCFRYRNGLKFGALRHKTFSGCDLFFAAQFGENSWVEPFKFHVVHLGRHSTNWKGRVTPEWK